jgi:hypothetical protein
MSSPPQKYGWNVDHGRLDSWFRIRRTPDSWRGGVQRLRIGTASDHCLWGRSRAQLDRGAVGGALRSGVLHDHSIGKRAIRDRAIR